MCRHKENEKEKRKEIHTYLFFFTLPPLPSFPFFLTYMDQYPSQKVSTYAAGGSPGYDSDLSAQDEETCTNLAQVLKSAGHAGVRVHWSSIGYEQGYACSVFRIAGLEEGIGSDVQNLLDPFLCGGTVVPVGRGSARVYVRRCNPSCRAATLFSFFLLTGFVLFLVLCIYYALHYVHPSRYYLPESLDPF
jgi:hypothetical protein